MSRKIEPNSPQANAPALKLLALDDDDLAVLSANTQDAIIRVADMAYLPPVKRFALVMARFDWEGALIGRCERRQAGLRFERVSQVVRSGLRQDQPEAILNLLSLSFEPAALPSGFIRLTFSGGAVIRLAVECIEAEMHDLGPRWPARAVPGHPLTSGADIAPQTNQLTDKES
jgi:Protein of unknown function (DUF2948)